MKIFLLAAVGYIAVILLAYVLQNKMLYFPAKATLNQLVRQTAAISMSLWPGEDAGYRGLMKSPLKDHCPGTIVVFHGNAGSAVDRSYYMRALHPLGYRVFLAEYPGYGARAGGPGEKAIVKDALETLAVLHETFGEPLYIWGESLGCGVAAACVADRRIPVAGVILLTPWDTLANVAHSAYPFLPTGLLLKDRYDNIRNLKQYPGPTAIIKAGRDEVIKNRFTDNLFAQIPGQKKLWTFDNAGHNSWPSDPSQPWWREVMTFVGGCKQLR
ncbi:MAG: alpha/beta fold hydrolase [Desulfobacteraceae bacterium]|nr:alpha/beta fold hydrolase [Desulfobacteraceae bacterium]